VLDQKELLVFAKWECFIRAFCDKNHEATQIQQKKNATQQKFVS